MSLLFIQMITLAYKKVCLSICLSLTLTLFLMVQGKSATKGMGVKVRISAKMSVDPRPIGDHVYFFHDRVKPLSCLLLTVSLGACPSLS
jgi:hypothetical protein